MKFLSYLPDKKHFRSIPSTKPGKYLWEDKGSSALRVSSLFPNPWGQQCKLILSPQRQKSDKTEYPYRLVINCYPLDGEGVPARINREYVKGVYAWSLGSPQRFYVFPTGKTHIWLCYSFYLGE